MEILAPTDANFSNPAPLLTIDMRLICICSYPAWNPEIDELLPTVTSPLATLLSLCSYSLIYVASNLCLLALLAVGLIKLYTKVRNKYTKVQEKTVRKCTIQLYKLYIKAQYKCNKLCTKVQYICNKLCTKVQYKHTKLYNKVQYKCYKLYTNVYPNSSFTIKFYESTTCVVMYPCIPRVFGCTLRF